MYQSDSSLRPFLLILVIVVLGAGMVALAARIVPKEPTKTPPVPVSMETIRTAPPEDLLHTIAPSTGLLTFLGGAAKPIPYTPPEDEHNAEAIARDFLKQYGKLFGITNDKQLKLIRIKGESSINTQEQRGGGLNMQGVNSSPQLTHVYFQQMYQDIPVYASELAVHMSNVGNIVSVNGVLSPLQEAGASVIPKLSKQEAFNIAAQTAFPTMAINTMNLSASLEFFDMQLTGEQKSKLVLSWIVEAEVKGVSAISPQTVFIDAQSGKVLQILDRTVSFERTIYDCNLRENCPEFPSNPARTEGVGSKGNTTIDLIFDRIKIVSDYYDGAIGVAVTSVPILARLPMLNALVYDNRIELGEGFDTLDVLGHEYGHKIVFNYIGQPVGYQNSAFHEGMADILGDGVQGHDWKLYDKEGSDGLTRNLTSGTSRKKIELSRLFSDQYLCPGAEGYGTGEHDNGMIIGHAAYLMAEGGIFNQCKIQAVGSEKTDKVHFYAVAHYITPRANFRTYYDAITQACADLYGAESNDCAQIKIALQATEVDQQEAGITTSTSCANPAARQVPLCASDNLPTTTPTTSSPTISASPTNSASTSVTSGVSPNPSPSPSMGTPQSPIVQPTAPSQPGVKTAPASCFRMQSVAVTDTSGNGISAIQSGQDFICKVTSNAPNNVTTCGLEVDGQWPNDICRYSNGYGFQGWSGNTASFLCNTNCVASGSCNTPTSLQGGSYALAGFDFSSECGPQTDAVVRTPVTISN